MCVEDVPLVSLIHRINDCIQGSGRYVSFVSNKSKTLFFPRWLHHLIFKPAVSFPVTFLSLWNWNYSMLSLNKWNTFSHLFLSICLRHHIFSHLYKKNKVCCLHLEIQLHLGPDIAVSADAAAVWAAISPDETWWFKNSLYSGADQVASESGRGGASLLKWPCIFFYWEKVVHFGTVLIL